MASIDEGAVRSAQPPREKPSEEVIATIEQLNNRLSGLAANLADLRERVSGSRPPEQGNRDVAATAFAIGGFVGSAGQGLERAHALVGDIETTLSNIVDVI
jgi:hypothetical protein